jgi:uncharacterized FlaG/YvyC family protein
MVFAQELINENGISAIALAFFGALFTAVSTIGVAIVNSRKKVQELKDVTVQAAKSAEAAQENTKNVSNGFAAKVDRKLDNIATNQDDLNEKFDNISTAFREHLEWHLNKEA